MEGDRSLSYTLMHKQHYDLKGVLIYFDIIIFFLVSAIFTWILAHFSVFYRHYIKAFDFALAVPFTIYLFILRPKMYAGEITAYYRKRYLGYFWSVGKFYCTIAAISAGRIGMALIYVIYQERNLGYVLSSLEGIYHPKITFIVLGISIFLYYIFFYQNKYIKMQEYSAVMGHGMLSLKLSETEAFINLMEIMDRKYGECIDRVKEVSIGREDNGVKKSTAPEQTGKDKASYVRRRNRV